ncbi:MAG: DUF885 family protein, partial [Steroidobacteraceae bacterium]
MRDSPALRLDLKARSRVGAALLLALAATEFTACSQHSRQHAADEQLRSIYTAEWQWRMQQLPGGEDDTKPVADHLPKVDPATQQMRLTHWLDVLRQVDALPRASLSAKQQINYDIYRAQLQVLIADQRFRDFEMPANSDTSFWTELGYTARRPFRTLIDYEHWIAQMRDIPRYFREQMDEMRAGMKRGFTPPRVTMEGRDTSITAVTEATPEASLFYTPFKDMAGVAADKQARLRAQAVQTIHDVVQPAYTQLLT